MLAAAVPTTEELHRDALEEALDAAIVLLRRIVAGAPLRSLQPRSSDYGKVFTPLFARQARAGYQAFWETLPLPAFSVDAADLDVRVVRGAVLGIFGAANAGFPPGYDDLRDALRGEPIWACAELRLPRASSTQRFDGLVQIDARWVWFPEPWRVAPRAVTPAIAHWVD